jgi:hypothetical protein
MTMQGPIGCFWDYMGIHGRIWLFHGLVKSLDGEKYKMMVPPPQPTKSVKHPNCHISNLKNNKKTHKRRPMRYAAQATKTSWDEMGKMEREGNDSLPACHSPCGRLRRQYLLPANISNPWVLTIHSIIINALWSFMIMERVKGIEPSYAAWEAAVLPLNYTRLHAIKNPAYGVARGFYAKKLSFTSVSNIRSRSLAPSLLGKEPQPA